MSHHGGRGEKSENVTQIVTIQARRKSRLLRRPLAQAALRLPHRYMAQSAVPFGQWVLNQRCPDTFARFMKSAVSQGCPGNRKGFCRSLSKPARVLERAHYNSQLPFISYLLPRILV
jgi:hypothetical protein